MAEDEKPIIDIFAGDPAPTDGQKRREYVAQVASLYKGILEPKLKHMLGNAAVLLEPADNDREFDQAVKGTMFAIREFMRWGQVLVNEDTANAKGENNSRPD